MMGATKQVTLTAKELKMIRHLLRNEVDDCLKGGGSYGRKLAKPFADAKVKIEEALNS